jgi:glucose-6-phosphate 1-epimerase
MTAPTPDAEPISPYLPPARPLLAFGNGGMPKLVLRARDGAVAEIYLHGGHVTSWRPAGGEERLFLSRDALYQEDAPIHGGIPVIFPRVGSKGPIPYHGFARRMEWELAYADLTPEGAATAILKLADSRLSWSWWRHRFILDLHITVSGTTLQLRLKVKNDGKKPFRFTGALHAHLRVRARQEARILGLQGLRYRDLAADSPAEPPNPPLSEQGIEQVYFDVPGPVTVQEPDRTLRIATTGFPDLMVWKPGTGSGNAMAPDDQRRALRAGPAVISRPVWLNPGDGWIGTLTLTAE